MIDNPRLVTEPPLVAGASIEPVVSTEIALAPPVALTRHDRRGMVSAEWAVGIIAAIAIAGVLLAVVTSGPVQDALLKFILQLIHSFSGFMK